MAEYLPKFITEMVTGDDYSECFTIPTAVNDSEAFLALESSSSKPSLVPEPEKINDITIWLEQEFGITDSTTKFERNEVAIDILHKLMLYNKERDSNVNQVIGNYNLKKKEYEMEAKRYATLIERIGIGIEHLDADVQTWLDTLAQINLILDLKSPTVTDFLLAVNHLQDAKMKIEDDVDVEKKLTTYYQKKTQITLQKSYELQRILGASNDHLALHEVDVTKQTKKMEFLPKKIEEYDIKLAKLKEKLELSAYRDEVRHDNLIKRNKELMKINNEIKASQVTLDTFSNLPPDLNIIKKKIEDVRKDLIKVDTALKAKISNAAIF